MHLIAYAIYIDVHKGWGFVDEVALQKSNHGGKSTLFRTLALFNNIQ